MVERKHIEAIGEAVDDLWCIDTVENYDLCNDAISAAIAAIDESPWRSMESAPRDGSPFVVHIKGVDTGVEFDYSDAAKFDSLCGKFVDMDGTEFVDDCMTEWMPLPAAPEVEDA